MNEITGCAFEGGQVQVHGAGSSVIRDNIISDEAGFKMKLMEAQIRKAAGYHPEATA
jgi:hypothetical protein